MKIPNKESITTNQTVLMPKETVIISNKTKKLNRLSIKHP